MTNQMSSAVKSNENRVLYVFLIMLMLFVGLVVGWQLGEASASRASQDYVSKNVQKLFSIIHNQRIWLANDKKVLLVSKTHNRNVAIVSI